MGWADMWCGKGEYDYYVEIWIVLCGICMIDLGWMEFGIYIFIFSFKYFRVMFCVNILEFWVS